MLGRRFGKASCRTTWMLPKGRVLSTGSHRDPCRALIGGWMPNGMEMVRNEKLIREEALWIADKLDWEVRQGTMTQEEAAVIINAVEPPLFRVIARWQKNVISDMEAVGRIREIRKAIDVLAR